MYPFSNSVTPAFRSHVDAQLAFFNDMSKSMSRSLQNVCELNIQLSQTLLEESTNASKKLMTSDRAADMLSIAAWGAQPTSEALRAYQQQISRVAADAQVELSRLAEQHVQETSRTARVLADEVAHKASEEAEQNLRKQEETLKSVRDGFEFNNASNGNSSVHSTGNQQSGGQDASGSVKFDTEAGSATFKANAAQAGGKGSGKSSQ